MTTLIPRSVARLSLQELVEPIVNSNMHIHDLPVEILALIFYFILLRAHEGRNVQVLVSQWRPVLQVCRRWRIVALESTDLWRVIPLDHAEWTRMALKLSGQRTVSLFFTPAGPKEITPTSVHDTIIQVLTAADHRIRDLHLRLLSPEKAPDLSLLATLKTLSMNELLNFELSAGEGDPIILDEIFKSEPPNLRHVSLDFCELHEPPRIFSPQLRTVRLSYCAHTRGYDLSRNIRDIQSLKLLRELRICAMNEDGSEPPTESNLPRVRLPLLNVLQVRGEYRSLYTYLAYIEAPYTCSFTLRTRDLDSDSERTPAKQTIDSLAELLRPKWASEIADRAHINVDVTLYTSTWRAGNLQCIVRRVGKDDEERRLLLDGVFYWGELSEEFRRSNDPETPSLASLTSLLPHIISTLTVKVVLNDDDWYALGPLLSRAHTLHFFFPRCAVHFPPDLVRRSPAGDGSSLSIIHLTYHDDAYTEQSDVNSFPSVRHLVLTSPIHIAIRLQVGESLPTVDEVETLRACGDRLDLLEYDPFHDLLDYGALECLGYNANH